MLYAVITTSSRTWKYKAWDYYSIYDKLMKLSKNNHPLCNDAARWCEFASVGGNYDTDKFDWRIEIQE